MNVKAIFLFSLILLLSASVVYAQDNSTVLSADSDDVSYGDHWALNGHGEWSIDENGSLIHKPSDKNYSAEDISIEFHNDNSTDLRKNSSDANRTQNASDILTPARINPLWDEFVKDPLAFMEKYQLVPKAPPATWNSSISDNPCSSPYSKEFIDFMNFVEKTRVRPDVIEAGNLNVYYSKGNVYQIRVLNPVGDPVYGAVNVTFIFNGKKINTKTDENGYASFKFNRQPGSYVVKAYVGNVSSKHKITVKSLFKTKDVSKKYKKSMKFKVRLVKFTGKSLYGKKIKITLKGKTATVKTNSKGIAVFNIPKNLKIGKYAIRTCYNGCVVKNKITVKK